MAKDVIKLGLDIDGLDSLNKNLDSAEKSASSLRKEFIEAKKEVDKLASADVIDQKALDEAIGKMAEIKDRMSDVNEQVSIFASSSKYERVSNSFGSIGTALKNLDFAKAEERAQSFAKAAAAISFKDAIGSVKQLGSTFMTVGKALLTNPLFLLAAAIIGISMAIIKVLKDMGVFEKMMDKLKVVMEFALFPIKLLIEGLEELAKWFGIASDAGEDLSKIGIEATDKYAKNQEDRTNRIINQLDREIRRRRLHGEETRDLERQKLELLAEETEKVKDNLDEQITILENRHVYTEAADEAELEAMRVKSRELRQEHDNRIKDISYFDEETQVLAEKRARATEAQEKADAERNENLRKQEAARLAAERQRRLKALERFADDEIQLRRRLEDLTTAAITDETERAIKQSEIRQLREIEDLKKQNELRLTALREAGVAESEIRKQREVLEAESQLIITNIEAAGIKERENLRQDAAKKEQDSEKQKLLNRVRLLDEFRLRQLEADGKFREADILQEQLNLNAERLRLQEAFENQLLDKKEYHELLEQAEREHKLRIEEINRLSNERTAQNDQRLIDLKLKAIKDSLDTISNLTELFNDNSLESARTAFDIQKGLQIATATIDTYKAANSAYAAVSGIPVVGPALGVIAAGAAITAGLLNVKKIASMKFDPGGGSTGGGGAPSAPSAPVPPAIQLFGGPMTGNAGGTPQELGERQMIKAIVVESDITETQERLSTYQQRSEIGE